MRVKLLFLLFPCFIYSAFGQKVLNGTNKDWNLSGSWSPSGVPTEDDSVYVNGTVFIAPGDDAFAKVIHIGSSGVLNVQFDNDSEDEGYLSIESADNVGIINEGTINNSGTIEIIETGSQGCTNENVINNSGSFLIETSGLSGMVNESGGKITNTGSMTLTFALENGLTNNGVFINEGNVLIETIDRHGLVNSDSLHNKAGAVITIMEITISENGIFLTPEWL